MIKQLFLLFTVLSILSVTVTGQMIGNHAAKLGQFPFHASVQELLDWEPSRHVCSATILAPHWVLTSATCYHFKEDLDYIVIAGIIQSYNATNPERQERYVTRIVVHPQYDGPPNYVNDIAVVELDQDLTFNQFVNKAKITFWTPVSNEDPSLTGWSFRNGTFGDKLQFINTGLTSEDECREQYPSHFPLIQKCYGPLYEVCLGYTSDPLILEGTVIGLSAYSSTGTCITGSPYIYTNVVMYYDFIKKYINT